MNQPLESGHRVGNETNEVIPADAIIRPLRDQIFVEPIDWEPSKTIKVVYGGKPLRGIVRAVGPGAYQKKYDGPKGHRTKSWDGKHFIPTEVKIGDTVELGGMELRGYLHMTVLWGTKTMIVCREADVAGVVHD